MSVEGSNYIYIDVPSPRWPVGSMCPTHKRVHNSHGWYVCLPKSLAGSEVEWEDGSNVIQGRFTAKGIMDGVDIDKVVQPPPIKDPNPYAFLHDEMDKPSRVWVDPREETVWPLALDYYDARPLPHASWTGSPRGHKVVEEAEELVEALGEHYDDPSPQTQSHVLEEIGDVAISLAWIAKCYGVTVEECMRLKTEVDRGRGTRTKEQHARDKALVDGLSGVLPLSPQDLPLLQE